MPSGGLGIAVKLAQQSELHFLQRAHGHLGKVIVQHLNRGGCLQRRGLGQVHGISLRLSHSLPVGSEGGGCHACGSDGFGGVDALEHADDLNFVRVVRYVAILVAAAHGVVVGLAGVQSFHLLLYGAGVSRHYLYHLVLEHILLGTIVGLGVDIEQIVCIGTVVGPLGGEGHAVGL